MVINTNLRIEAVTGMISKNRAKFIKSLQLKKFRKQEGLFVVEGGKSVLEVLQSNFTLIELYVTSSFYAENEFILKLAPIPVEIVSERELEMASGLQSNNAALAVVQMPAYQFEEPVASEFALVLDDVRDPGNLGTIIRIADWYGIGKVYCSPETTDLFAGKVVQACMGSLTRVKVFYTALNTLLEGYEGPVYGALLNGKNIYDERFDQGGLIVMGNESNGISAGLLPLVSHPITIPGHGGAESLNVAVATAIVCDNVRRPKS